MQERPKHHDFIAYAHKNYPETDMPFDHVFPSELQVRLCGSGGEKIYKVQVKVDPNGPYWAWDDGEDISMIWRYEMALKMCFPYGMKAAIEAGQGVPVKLSISEAT